MTSKKTYRIMHAVQTVAVIIIGLAFLFLIGTCGSLECDVITLGQAFIRLIVGILVVLACDFIYKRLEAMEQSMQRSDAIAKTRLAENKHRQQERWNAYFGN